MAKANASALGLADRVTFQEADAITVPLPDVRAAFADPGRRADGRRHLDPEDYTPSLSSLRGQFAPDIPLAVKVAPGVAWDDVGHLGAEVEFVSVDRELKECVLWFGPLRTAARRATVLPSPRLCGERVAALRGGVRGEAPDPSPPTPLPQGARGESTLHADAVLPMPPVEAVGAYLLDPDPAVVRAGLAPLLAEQLGLSPIDYTVALFTGPEPVASPFVTAYRVEFADRFHVNRLRDHLRARGVGRVTVIKRGSMIDADELVRKLKLAGSEHRVVLLTRTAGEQTMIVGARVLNRDR
jgi:hypothetical protein